MANTLNTLADKKRIDTVIAALKNNGIDAHYFDSEEEGKKKALSIIPEGAEVMDMTSVTLDKLGITKEVQTSGKYNSVRAKLLTLEPQERLSGLRKLGSVADYAIGSAQAITESGEIINASATGSQLPAYAYGANHVIFVLGTNKLVKDYDEAIKRIYDHILPLESARVKIAYGLPKSSVNKILITKQEKPGRVHVILIGKELGY